VFIELPKVGWLVLLLICHYLPCIFFLKQSGGWQKQNWQYSHLPHSVSKVMFLVQSALLGWLWGLPAAKELRRSGALALWR